MDQTVWKVMDCDEAAAQALSMDAGVSPVMSRLLVNRGVKTASDLKMFLDPSLAGLHDPYLLPDVEEGVERIADAIVSGEKICVYGDYDVDGVTSTALLVRTLRALKANVEYRLPHRQRDGYDIKPPAIDAAAESGCTLVVTCDCGINACSTADRARELGIDLIITDHHEPGAELPNAVAVINPKRRDSNYPFVELAGVGVALKVAQALVRLLGHDEESFLSRFVDLAALGTVADVVPLLDENRAIVKFGLDLMPKSKKVGLKTILRTTGLDGKAITTHYVGYILGPRINAVGRMDDAHTALKLFLTKDENEARILAETMERHNSDRKVEQERILAETSGQLESIDLASSRILVLSSDGWNPGVIGIVAGRICETHCRPTILIARDEASGMGVGSARSIDAFHMRDALARCSDLFTHFGGHALAAGFTIPLENISAFEERISAHAIDTISDEELAPRIRADVELVPQDITRELANSLLKMEPFGEGNLEPMFITRNFKVLNYQRVGDGSHLKLKVQGWQGAPIDCIAFRMGDMADRLELGGSVDLCYNIRLNTYNGVESVQLVGKAIKIGSSDG
ncbi:MAG: single-stranded-DNA-specific exonuclease RecJ [Armatimonadota bacterium]|nr:single-stranded-DNA-specific exonuclease RecJ [bacterium]